jgi:hypothetical protein
MDPALPLHAGLFDSRKIRRTAYGVRGPESQRSPRTMPSNSVSRARERTEKSLPRESPERYD